MYCEFCGKENAANVKFCIYCGGRVSVVSSSNVPPQTFTPIPQNVPQGGSSGPVANYPPGVNYPPGTYYPPVIICPRCGSPEPKISAYNSGLFWFLLCCLSILGGIIYYMLRKDKLKCIRCGNVF